jgi:ABC-type nitrate/sulfonate/bicarbonate transport system permease component
MPFRFKVPLLYITVLTVSVLLWTILSVPLTPTGITMVSPLKLPSPTAVLNAAAAVGTQELLRHITATLLRVLAGGLLGTFLGWLVGLLMSQFSTFRSLLNPFIESLRPVPALAVFPMLILWVGIGFLAQMVVVTIATFSIVVIATHEAAVRVDRRFLLATQNFGGDAISELFFVLIPQTLPALIGPLRICVALAFANAIGAEFLGAQQGLGYMIRNARVTLNTAGIILGTLLIGVLAVAVDFVIRRLGQRSTKWLDLIR